MILEIQKGGNNPILKEKTTSVKSITEEIVVLAKDMIETMIKNEGLGLSANQVGKNIRMFVVHPDLTRRPIFINPEITKTSKRTDVLEEGCLSLPGIYRPVNRTKSIKIKALNQKGKQFKLKANDLLARVIQHEIDHLNGILITDK